MITNNDSKGDQHTHIYTHMHKHMVLRGKNERKASLTLWMRIFSLLMVFAMDTDSGRHFTSRSMMRLSWWVRSRDRDLPGGVTYSWITCRVKHVYVHVCTCVQVCVRVCVCTFIRMCVSQRCNLKL
jgi:hypothetical protein